MNDIYGIDRWGDGLIKILENGHIGLTHPQQPAQKPVDLMSVVDSLTARGIASPVLLRVADFLDYRIDHIHKCFAEAIAENQYEQRYMGVFPIKVNQQAEVIERIVGHGRQYDFGLEVGSKAELLIALSHDISPDAALICNGIKDEEFIRLALMSQQLGYNSFLVLESPRELELVLRLAQELNMRPQLGIRIKLTHRISGNWAASSGDRSSFGMTIAQVMDVIESLKREDYLDCLVLQHSHLGSQIPNILEIRHATQEACRFFAQIRAQGAPLTYLDLGGGLGIDYTGEQKPSDNSINYSLPEYCFNIIETVKFALAEADCPHPIIITESGRACVAQSSMLIFNILEVTHYDSDTPQAAAKTDHPLIHNMVNIADYLDKDRAQECWNDLSFYRDEMRALFRRGQVSLAETAKAERIYLYLMKKIKDYLLQNDHLDEELQTALAQTADIYHGNFSLFQSLPDIWAIDQIHPIAPIHHLHTPPNRRAILSDITCDSDGKIDRFVLEHGISSVLPVHEIKTGDDYYLGVFFIGAYQETLGDLHNLFGDTNVVTIKLGENGRFDLTYEQEGDTISEVLSYVEYNPRHMVDKFKAIVERGVTAGRLSPSDRKTMIKNFKDSINGYTYYEN